jgi:hypothetical protein
LAKSRLEQAASSRNNALLNDNQNQLFYNDFNEKGTNSKNINNENFENSPNEAHRHHRHDEYETNDRQLAQLQTRLSEPEVMISDQQQHTKVIEEPETGRLQLIYDA